MIAPPMDSSLLISVAFAIVTTGAATLWAVLLADGLSGVPDGKPAERRDIQTW
jgi:hypothetical protein